MPDLSRRSFVGLSAAALAGTALAGTAAGLPLRRAAARPVQVAQSTSSAAGFAPGALDAVAETARGLDQLHSLVISRNGEIALAETFRGPGLETPVNVKSASKTLVAALVGAALARGVLPGGVPAGVETAIGEVAPQLIPPQADPQVADITLADLLSLQAGLERTSGANYGRWVESANWVAYALSRPLVRTPGEGFLYSTGSTHVAGAVLAEAAGRSLLDLARDWLGAPLGIEIPPWTRDPQGYYLGGNNMALSPLALWRFGEMVRQGGLWAGEAGGAERGQRVLPAAWIEASWRPRAVSPFSGHAYGYGWFLARLGSSESASGRASGDASGSGGLIRPENRPLAAARGPEAVEVAYARGYGGQMLYLVPHLGLTVAITSDPTRPARSAGYAGDLNRLLAERIVPAVEAE
jgi:CubicO group peptidase (beta-lactamase class C family)